MYGIKFFDNVEKKYHLPPQKYYAFTIKTKAE